MYFYVKRGQCSVTINLIHMSFFMVLHVHSQGAKPIWWEALTF